jgi:hypothetical protein
LSPAIAEKSLVRSLTEIEALLLLALAELEAAGLDDDAAAGAELLLELLELLQPAATSTAAKAAAAVRPARADTEYNGVPRSFTQTCRMRHVRDQIRLTRSQLTGLLAKMLDLRGETFPLTLS